jgi:hypothetical protein
MQVKAPHPARMHAFSVIGGGQLHAYRLVTRDHLHRRNVRALCCRAVLGRLADAPEAADRFFYGQAPRILIAPDDGRLSQGPKQIGRQSLWTLDKQRSAVRIYNDPYLT